MAFSDQQIRALSRNVPARVVRTRSIDGRDLSYLEGWFVIAQANRIFGFDGWNRETIETRNIHARENRGAFVAAYAARVRITVRAGDAIITREGHGTGEAHGASAGEVHDRALKAAETDATKRALATFGKAFGLNLYAGQRRSAVPARSTSIEPASAPTSGQGLPAASIEAPHELSSQANGPTGRSGASEPSLMDANGREPTPRTETGPMPERPAVLAPVLRASPSVAAKLLRASSTRIDKSALALSEPRRVRDKQHLRFVALQPCLVCGTTPADSHHIRFAQPTALGRKVGDEFTVPLCRAHHRELHHCGNEAAWWHDMGVDPLKVARLLWAKSESHRQRQSARMSAP